MLQKTTKIRHTFKTYNTLGDFMFLSDLQEKDIISTKSGRKIGRIIDAEINNEGVIVFLIVEEKKNIKKFMMSGNDTKISFDSISKIGEDVILVNV